MRHDTQKGSLMSSKIYVGNLPYSVNDAALHSNFAAYGKVSSAKVMMDRDTGQSKGFGFVDMGTAESAQAAIEALNGMSVDGRAIVVSLARPREDRSAGGAYSPAGYRASHRPDVGYGNGGFGGGRY
jgi:RNA recognition motif-containing protein